MSRRPKYWPVYPKDLWGDHNVQDLQSGVHRCAYIALLSWAWERGAVLRDPIAALEQIGFPHSDASSIWHALRHLFSTDEQGWFQARQRRDWQDAVDKCERASRKGKNAADARWNGGDDASGIAPSNATGNASSNACAMPSVSVSVSEGEEPPISLREMSPPRGGTVSPSVENSREGPDLERAVALIDEWPALEPVRDLWARYLAAVRVHRRRRMPNAAQVRTLLAEADALLASKGLAHLRESMRLAALGGPRGPWESFPVLQGSAAKSLANAPRAVQPPPAPEAAWAEVLEHARNAPRRPSTDETPSPEWLRGPRWSHDAVKRASKKIPTSGDWPVVSEVHRAQFLAAYQRVVELDFSAARQREGA